MKSKTVAIILAFFLGCWGIHQFYLGNGLRGVLYLIVGLLGIFFIIPLLITGVLALIDIIIIAMMDEQTFINKYSPAYANRMYQQPPMQQFYQQPQYPQQRPQYPQQQYPQPAQPMQQPHYQQPAQPSGTNTAKLKELKSLLDSGALTQEEFDNEKRKILGN